MAARGYARCPDCGRDVRTASGRLCTHGQIDETCPGSRKYFTRCDYPGMVAGESCVLAAGHDGGHLTMRVTPRK